MHHTDSSKPTATIACTILALTTFVLAGPADAATFNVTKTSDSADGQCNADCSLREAIIAANNSTDLIDLVVVPAGVYTLTIDGAADDDCLSGDLDVLGTVLVIGQDPASTTIDASQITDRVLHVVSGSTSLRDLTITGGRALGIGEQGEGGGILAEASLTLDNVVVDGNEAAYNGGGVRSTATLELKNGSSITHNHSDGTGVGGGLSVVDAELVMTDSTVAYNTAERAAGVHVNNCDTTIQSSTISHNSAALTAGGLYASNLSIVEISNSTIANNAATISGADASVGSSSTVSFNAVTIGGDPENTISTLHLQNAVTFVNTLVKGRCDGIGPFASLGGNIESPDATCGFSTSITDPRLTDLGDFGGPTHTMVPLPDSLLIGHATASCLPTDQRGEARGGVCTTGAAERVVSDPTFYAGFEPGDLSEWSVVFP